MNRRVTVQGVGLHTGAPACVVLEAMRGPIRLRSKGAQATIDEWTVAPGGRSTTVQGREGVPSARTVEHILAALGGLAVYRGVVLTLDGPEMPFVDGGARAWCDAVAKLDPPRGTPKLRVVRAGIIEVGRSLFEFGQGERIEVAVHVEFGDPRISPHADWHGDPEDFQTRIAPARTFALAHELDELFRAGLARHVDPHAVVLIDAEAIHCAGAPFSADEPARHKLLDLVGDLYAFGGPPLGSVRAFRPGHAVNVEAARRALASGILASN